MNNHLHLVGVPLASDALARMLRQTHADCARYTNVKRRTNGHLRQNRYFSRALDGSYCWRRWSPRRANGDGRAHGRTWAEPRRSHGWT